jgi:hypothetical protein
MLKMHWAFSEVVLQAGSFDILGLQAEVAEEGAWHLSEGCAAERITEGTAEALMSF